MDTLVHPHVPLLRVLRIKSRNCLGVSDSHQCTNFWALDALILSHNKVNEFSPVSAVDKASKHFHVTPIE